jgi:hypothetical protein
MFRRIAGLIMMALALFFEVMHVSNESFSRLSSYEFHHRLGIGFLVGLFFFLWGLNSKIKSS